MNAATLADFFEVTDLKEDEGKYKALIKLNSGHAIYEGHFPGNPVVPGVCLIQMLKELVEKVMGREVMLSRAGNIKFLQVIDPNKQPDIHWEVAIRNTENSEIEIRSTAFSGEKVCFKFSGVFK